MRAQTCWFTGQLDDKVRTCINFSAFFFPLRIEFVQLKAGNSAEAGIYVVHVEKFSDFFSPRREIVLKN